MSAHLRVYPGIEEMDDLNESELSIRIRLRDLIPLLSLAQKQRFIWIQDFLDDEVAVSSDLNDVLRAFHSCRPSA